MTSGAPNGVAKRSLTIAGHRTSVSLEEPFWRALGRIAAERGLSVQALVAGIDAERGGGNLSSALRVFVLRTLEAGSAGRQGPGPDGGTGAAPGA